MTTSAQSASFSGSRVVNLFCTQCHSQLGKFDNEWARLTSSYMRPTHAGQHFGTEIGQKTQTVPHGVTQQAAEGCSMAEVFCKKCSLIVAQYCKASPTIAQHILVNQYFYKISRIYLKSADNKSTVDPVFGFAGDLVRSSVRPSVPPFQRVSHTPMRNEFPSARLQSLSQPQSLSRQPSLFRNQSNPELDGCMTRLSRLEEIYSRQDQRHEEQDARMQAILDQLDEFRGCLDGLRHSNDSRPPRVTSSNLDCNGFERNLESFTEPTRQSQTDSSGHKSLQAEIAMLRAENAALKAKLNNITSGIPPSTPDSDVPPTRGKRKRKGNENIAGSEVPAPDRFGARRTTQRTGAPAAFVSLPTPQSSNLSENDNLESRRRKKPRASAVAAVARTAKIVLDDDTSSLDELGHDFVPPNDALEDENNHDSNEAFVVEQPSNYDRSSEDRRNTQNSAPLAEAPSAEYINFSDEESADRVPPVYDDFSPDEEMLHARTDDSGNGWLGSENESRPESPNYHFVGDDDENASDRVFQKPRTSQRSRSRRVTDPDFEQNMRSQAPEPIPRRRTLPARGDRGGMDKVNVMTPALHEQLLRDGRRRPETPFLQTTEKMLNQELTDLGLQSWIPLKGKNTNPEYRKAVETARVQQREKNKFAKLASVGISLPITSQKEIQRDSPPAVATISRHRGETIAQESNDSASTPILSDIVNEQTDSAITPVQEPVGMMTRRKQQRQEEIRRRDQLAKEALEMDD